MRGDNGRVLTAIHGGYLGHSHLLTSLLNLRTALINTARREKGCMSDMDILWRKATTRQREELTAIHGRHLPNIPRAQIAVERCVRALLLIIAIVIRAKQIRHVRHFTGIPDRDITVGLCRVCFILQPRVDSIMNVVVGQQHGVKSSRFCSLFAVTQALQCFVPISSSRLPRVFN